MRTEREMLDLILTTARNDERIRAVIMNGSRTNPNAPRDIFQDFDILYLVTEVEPFANNLEWIARFGDLTMLQMPETMDDPPPANDGHFGYLMLFTDGNRIDLTLFPVARLGDVGSDSLSILLLDKDGLLEPFPPPSDRDYLPTPPTAKAFDDCCNEFWWVATGVAKGLWRGEPTYAKYVQEHFVRDQLTKMLTWYVGVKTDFSKSPGKWGKYLEGMLGPELWEMLKATYADADEENAWNALFTMCELFRVTSRGVAGHFGLVYPQSNDERVSAYLRRVRELPRV
jgi:aminoglycoside 6-adenylyltransferase